MTRLKDSVERTMFYGATPIIFERARILRMNLTRHEIILWNFLKNKQLMGLKFRRQHPIGRFIADFYCHQKKVVIEIDGESHFNEEAKEYDEGRTAEFERLDIKMIRFTNHEVEFEIEQVVEKIKKFLTMHQVINS
jgi:very-short-patch-repair endonuclease